MPDPIPQALRKAVAVYEAGKALMAYITPEFEEIARVSASRGWGQEGGGRGGLVIYSMTECIRLL